MIFIIPAPPPVPSITTTPILISCKHRHQNWFPPSFLCLLQFSSANKLLSASWPHCHHYYAFSFTISPLPHSSLSFSFMCLLDCFTNCFLHHFSLQFCVCQKLSFHGLISFLFLFWVIYLPSPNPQKTHDVLFHFLMCFAHHHTG